MRYVQTTAPTSEPVTLTEAYAQCGLAEVSDASQAQLFSGWIKTARELFERINGRQLVTATWKLYLDWFPPEIELRILPVATVTSITYVDTDGVTQTLSASGYQTDITSKDRPARILPAYGTVWPCVRGDTVNPVIVTFTAGYGEPSAVPQYAKDAILARVTLAWQFREGVALNMAIGSLPLGIQTLYAMGDWGAYG